MGLVGYSSRETGKKRDTKDARPLREQRMAVMARQYNSILDEDEPEAKPQEPAEAIAAEPEVKPQESIETIVAEPENKDRDDDDNDSDDDDDNDDDDDDDDDERSYLDISQKEIKIAGEDQSITVNAETGEISGTKGDVEASVNLVRKTFKLSWGKQWSSDDEEDEEDEDGDSEEQESENKEDKSPFEMAKEAAAAYYKDAESNSAEALEKLGFAKDALIVFFRTGKLPENKYGQDSDQEEESSALKLDAEWPIFPGISFVASLEPSWSFGFHFDFELAQSDEAAGIEVEMEGDKVKKITCPDIERVLSLTAEVMGKLGVTLRLALRAGAGYLFYVEGGLFATGEAKGILEGGSEESFGRGKLDLPIILEGANKKIRTGNASMKLDAGIGIFGSVGGDVKAASEIFDWEKELYSYTFKEWNPANFMGAIYLKQNKNKGGLLNPRSWEKEKSEFRIDLFKKHIEGQKKYGLVMTDATLINTRASEGKALQDKLVEIHNTFAAIEAKMSAGPAGGQFAAEGSEAYDSLMQELEGVGRHLNNMLIVGNNKLEEMKAAMLEYQQDKHYKGNLEKASAGKQKHEERLQKMQEWGKQFGEGQEEARSNSAYIYYENAFDAKGALRQKKDAQLTDAQSSVATKEALIAYEKERIEQLGKKHNDRIALLTELLAGMSEQQKNSPNPEFVKKYRNMGGTAFLKTAQQYAGKDKLIAYEKERLKVHSKKHRQRAAQLEEKLGASGFQISEADRKKPNRAFAEYYYHEMKGKRFFAEDQIIHNHQSGAEIVQYERERLRERAGKNVEHIERLEQFKARYDRADATQEEKQAVMEEARSYYKSVGLNRLGRVGQGDMDIAGAASKQDILDYEMRRLTAYQAGGGKKQKSFAAEKEALDRLKGVTQADAGSGDSLLADLGAAKLQQVWKAYKEWMKGQEDNTVRELIPLSMILEYEKKQKTEVHDRLTKKKRTEAQIAADADYRKHQQRYRMLENKVLELQEEQNQETVEKETNAVREAYFKDAKELLKEVKNGDRKDARLLKAVLERRTAGYGGEHADRLTKLREFMELDSDDSDAGKSSKSDAQVWEYYQSIGAGKAFAEDFAKRRNGKFSGKFSIEDMLRYEQHAAREHSQTNIVKATVSRKVEAKIADYTTKEGGAALEEKKKKEKEGGHYDRYMALKAKLDSGVPDKDIVEYYLSIGGGGGYVKSPMKGRHFLDVVTPEEILGYEQTRNGRKGEHHAKRLEMLAGLDDGLSDEEVYKKYHASALEDSGGKKFAERVGLRQHSGFDATIKPEDVVTPQMIFDYEKKRVTELTDKHTTRVERLDSEDVTAENVLSVYRDAGGGRGFFGANREQLRAKTAEIGDSHNFQNILDYEQVRIEYYQKIMDEINEPLRRIEEAQAQLRRQIEEAQLEQRQIEKYLGASGKQAVFSSRTAFETFTEETTGAEIQDNVDKGQEKVDTLVKRAQQAKQEAEQIRKDRLASLTEDRS